MFLINKLYTESQKDDVTRNLDFLSLKQMGKHLAFSITESHSTLLNAIEDMNFIILGQSLYFKTFHSGKLSQF
jgi:hypothetical protein